MLRRVIAFLFSACVFLLPAVAQTTPPAYLQEAFYGTNTLQSWYTQSSGLYQTTGWWNAANSITVLSNYSRLDQTDAYYPVFANTLKQAPLTNAGFINDYYDDEGWWALAWIDVYDLTKQPEYLAAATVIFTDMTGGWDNTCQGGIWWSKARSYKNAIANELFLSVAAELAARTTDSVKRATYLDWAQREWNWFHHSGMINSQNLINDGLDTATCQNNQQKTWSYNQGVILGGLTQLSALNGDKTLLTTAQSIANAAITNLTDSNGVLRDGCEPNCGADGVQFKGVFLRNLTALQAVVHDPKFETFADTNAQSIWNHARGPNYQLGQTWAGPFDAGNAASQTSALDAILAAASMQMQGAGGNGGAQPAFTLTASPATIKLATGASADAAIQLTPSNGFSGDVHLTATLAGSPAGVQVSLSSETLNGSGQTTLSIYAGSNATGGTYLIGVTGVSGGLAKTVYVTLVLPDFSLSLTNNTLYLNQAQSIEDPLTVQGSNGFTGSVGLDLSTLPTLVSGSFSPQMTSSESVLRLSANVLAPTTSGQPITVTGQAGSTSHTIPSLSVAVSATASDCGLGTLVNLASSFNVTALHSDGSTFTDGGIDGVGFAYSSNLLGAARVLNGIRFRFGAPDVPNGVYANGQTLLLPQGRFNALQLIGTGVNGNQTDQALTVTYTDGTKQTVLQSLSDWFGPDLKVNEQEAVAMGYRNEAGGTSQKAALNLYGYTFALEPGKIV